MDQKAIASFTEHIAATYGEPARKWGQEFPTLLSHYQNTWNLQLLDEPYAKGSKGLIVPVFRERPMALKIAFDTKAFGVESKAIENWQPYAVAFHEKDDQAMLMDWLDPIENLDLHQAGKLLASIHSSTKISGQDSKDSRIDYVLGKIKWRAERAQLDFVLLRMNRIESLADQLRELSGEDFVVCHGDPHPGNFMFKQKMFVIDPWPVWAEREYDYAYLLRQVKNIDVLTQQLNDFARGFDLDIVKLRLWNEFLLYQEIAYRAFLQEDLNYSRISAFLDA